MTGTPAANASKSDKGPVSGQREGITQTSIFFNSSSTFSGGTRRGGRILLSPFARSCICLPYGDSSQYGPRKCTSKFALGGSNDIASSRTCAPLILTLRPKRTNFKGRSVFAVAHAVLGRDVAPLNVTIWTFEGDTLLRSNTCLTQDAWT